MSCLALLTVYIFAEALSQAPTACQSCRFANILPLHCHGSNPCLLTHVAQQSGAAWRSMHVQDQAKFQLILFHELFCLCISDLPPHARLHVISHFCLWVLKLLFSLTDVDVCVFDCRF